MSALKESTTFRRAADRLHVTETALSKRLTDLETRVGCQLVQRDRRPYAFTEAGEFLSRRGSELLHAAQLLDDDFERFKTGRLRRLHLAIECHSCYDWFFDALSEYERRWQDVELAALDEYRFGALEPLREGKLDLVVTADPEPQRNVELAYIKLFDYEARLAVASSHKLAAQSVVTDFDLQDETLLTFPVPQHKQHIFKAFLFPASMAPKSVVPLQDPRFMIYRVSRQRGVACLPDWAIESFAQQYNIVSKRLGDGPDGVKATMYAAVRSDMQTADHIQNFCKVAIHQFNKHKQHTLLAA